MKLTSQESTKISLPQEVVNTIIEQHAHYYGIHSPQSPVLFPVRNETDSSTTVVGSQVVSATVNGIKNGATLTGGGQVTFSLRLKNVPTLEEEEFITNRRCVFWDFAGAGKPVRIA